MLYTLIFWLYVLNFTLIIIHEMDSVYWHEWDLFKMPGGKNLFLMLHLPLIPIFLYGLIPVHNGVGLGIIFVVVLALIGILAFGLHMFFIAKGNLQFKTTFSIGLLIAILIVSILQMILVASIKVT